MRNPVLWSSLYIPLKAFVAAARSGRLQKATGTLPKCIIGTLKTPLSLGLSSGYSVADICNFYTVRRQVPGGVPPFEEAFHEFCNDLAYEESVSALLSQGPD